MAQVDFSNAVLDANSGKPMKSGNYLLLASTSYLYNSAGNIVSTPTVSVITNTPAKVSILFTGTFNQSGTEVFLGNMTLWRASNISFSNGDTYSFIIDIETSGNT